MIVTGTDGVGFAGWGDLVARVDGLRGARVIVAVAGPPGAGKSTLAEALADSLNARGAGTAAVVPMDGFHYDDAVLSAWGLLPRKGSPATFDVAGFRSLIARLRRNDEGTVAVPVFDRRLELSRASARIVDRDVRVLVVEGNYLLLDDPAWATLRPFYDLTVMVTEDRATLRARLLDRWRRHGHDAASALAKAEGNDLPNADLVLASSVAADLCISAAPETFSPRSE